MCSGDGGGRVHFCRDEMHCDLHGVCRREREEEGEGKEERLNFLDTREEASKRGRDSAREGDKPEQNNTSTKTTREKRRKAKRKQGERKINTWM